MPEPVQTPQLAWPFRLESKPDGTVEAAVVEQDSLDDLRGCLQAILRTPVGFRDELPEFGVEDPTFRQMPISTTLIERQLQRWEPRATIKVTGIPDSVDEALQHITIYYEDPGA